MEYRQFDSPAVLAPFVECLWTLTGDATELDGGAQPVLPDGRPELVIHFRDAFDRLHADGRSDRQPLVIFAGQLDSQLTLRPSGAIGVLGVRFRPYGAGGWLRDPQVRLVGRTAAVEDLSPQLAGELRRVRSRTDDPVDAVPHVQRALVKTLRGAPLDARVRHVADVIQARGGQVAIDALAAAAGLTRRHLERRFLDTVGLSPKRLARIVRFQRAVAALEQHGAPGAGAATAAACGYADQPHFIRDFRDLAGCSPSEHLLHQAELTGFFVQRLR